MPASTNVKAAVTARAAISQAMYGCLYSREAGLMAMAGPAALKAWHTSAIIESHRT